MCLNYTKEISSINIRLQNHKKLMNNLIIEYFTIKPFFKDWRKKSLDAYPILNIRPIVFSNVGTVLKYKTSDSFFCFYLS